MPNGDILKQKVKPVEDSSLDSRKVNLTGNIQTDSNSLNEASSALMQIGGALHKEDQIRKREEKDMIEQLSKENLATSTKIFKFKTKDTIADSVSSFSKNKSSYLDDPEKYYSDIKIAENEMTKSINDSNLNDVDKEELIFHLGGEFRNLNDSFYKENTEHVKNKNNSDLETLQFNQSNRIIKEIASNNFGNMETYLDDFVETANLRRESNPDKYTQKQMNYDVTKLTSDMMESYIYGEIEKIKFSNDLETIEGVGVAKEQISKLEEDLVGEGFAKVTEQLIGRHAENGKQIKKELSSELNKLVVKEKGILNNKTKSIEKKVKTDRIKNKNETALHMETLNSMPVSKETLAENGGTIYANAKLGTDVTTNEEGLELLKANNERSSLYRGDEMKYMQQIYKDQGYQQNIEASMNFVKGEYSVKVNGELDEYWEDQFWLDMEEASGGAINKEVYKTYVEKDKDMLEILRVNQKFNGADTSLVDMQEITSSFRFYFTDPKGDEFAQESANYDRALEDVENYGGQIAVRSSTTINNVALGNFVESLTPSKLESFERLTSEEQYEKVSDYYSDPKRKAKLYEQSRKIQKMYLGDNTFKVLSDGTPVIVPERYEDVDLDAELNKAKYYDLILPNGATLNKSYYNAVTVGGIKSKGLSVGVTEEIEDGLIIKYGGKPMSIEIDGVVVPATIDALSKLSNIVGEVESEEVAENMIKRVLDNVQKIRKGGKTMQIDSDLKSLKQYGSNYARGEGEKAKNSYYGMKNKTQAKEKLNIRGESNDRTRKPREEAKDITKELDVKIKKHTIKREGKVNRTYKDSLGKPTGGIGHLMSKSELKKYPVGTKIPEKQVNEWFEKDIAKAKESALKQAKEIGVTDNDFITILTSVNFQLGTKWNKKFPKAYKYLKQGEYEKAINEIEESLWEKQTPTRTKDFVNAIKKL